MLRTHNDITECAVVGLADDEWGQLVAAAIILSGGSDLNLKDLRKWGKDKMAAYKIPRLIKVVDELPRNPLGKVQKPLVTKLFD